MKRTTKTYDKLCGCCLGSGMMENPSWNPNVTADPQTIICKVCQGVGVQKVTEIIEED